MKKVASTKKCILINVMFAGSYLKEGVNIGHEVVNLFMEDNERLFIHVNKDGKVPPNVDVDTVLFVRGIAKQRGGVYKVEVIAKAEGCRTINDLYGVPGNGKFVKDNNVKYGGVLLSEVFRSNRYNRNAEDNESIFVTLQATKITYVKKRVYIVKSDPSDPPVSDRTDPMAVCVHVKSKCPTGQYLRVGITDEGDISALQSIIDNPSLWDEARPIMKADVSDYVKDSSCFLFAIGMYNTECAISNMLANMLRVDDTLTNRFMQNVLHLAPRGIPYVKREEAGIDLLICDDANYIVIEHKIKAEIGSQKDRQTGKNVSQLEKYARYAFHADDDANGTGQIRERKRSFFLLAPDYREFESPKLKFTIETEHIEYRLIRYSEVLRCFRAAPDYVRKAPYFLDFIHALELHSGNVDRSDEKVMRARFEEAIIVAKARQSM